MSVWRRREEETSPQPEWGVQVTRKDEPDIHWVLRGMSESEAWDMVMGIQEEGYMAEVRPPDVRSSEAAVMA